MKIQSSKCNLQIKQHVSNVAQKNKKQTQKNKKNNQKTKPKKTNNCQCTSYLDRAHSSWLTTIPSARPDESCERSRQLSLWSRNCQPQKWRRRHNWNYYFCGGHTVGIITLSSRVPRRRSAWRPSQQRNRMYPARLTVPMHSSQPVHVFSAFGIHKAGQDVVSAIALGL